MNAPSSILTTAGALLLASTLAGCAGATANIIADRSRYPISMSAVVWDDAGRLHDSKTLRRLGQFSFEETRVGILYGQVTPRPCDISDAVNEQVGRVSGEAVVNLKVTVTEQCALLNEFPVLSILPIWPGCVPVKIEGTIVGRVPATPIREPAPKEPPPPATEPPAAHEASPHAGDVTSLACSLATP